MKIRIEMSLQEEQKLNKFIKGLTKLGCRAYGPKIDGSYFIYYGWWFVSNIWVCHYNNEFQLYGPHLELAKKVVSLYEEIFSNEMTLVHKSLRPYA
jgi:hypothetical protein